MKSYEVLIPRQLSGFVEKQHVAPTRSRASPPWNIFTYDMFLTFSALCTGRRLRECTAREKGCWRKLEWIYISEVVKITLTAGFGRQQSNVLLPVGATRCFSTQRESWLSPTAGNTLTWVKYLTQPHIKTPFIPLSMNQCLYGWLSGSKLACVVVKGTVHPNIQILSSSFSPAGGK